ncbi:MAG: SpoIIE family protein phosphatase, partial [Acidobacteriota bacterium]
MATSDPRDLLRRVEEVVQQIERSGRDKVPIHSMIEAIVRELGGDVDIAGARLYQRSAEDYVLMARFPGGLAVDDSLRVPRDYAPMELALMRGVVYMEADDPRLDAAIESMIGAEEFAAIEVDSERYVIAFDVEPGHRDAIVNALGVIRHAVTQKIREQEVEEIFQQAKQIQRSILPTESPKFSFYDIAGRSDSLDSVGGDIFDYIPIHEGILGVAIADASGHGLPAALQVRDVYMGLRMGMARDLKIVRTVERLNQIIHNSTLTSRFVSLFYGELESNGLFIYVNAGHPAPFHLRKDPRRPTMSLREGGPILGP